MSKLLEKTIGNDEWLKVHETELKALFPADWSHACRVSMLKIGWELKLLGVEWRSEIELINIFVYFGKIGIVEHDPDFKEIIRANPKDIFEKVNK